VSGFLVDQQLPKALATYLTERGHDAHHVKDYPDGAILPDTTVARIADDEGRFVVTKDDDFRITHLLHGTPANLLHVTCGNISTGDLLAMFDSNWPALVAATALHAYVEIDRAGVSVRDRD
jgi:predicted nuclease of predicted toxin-antitoxin system